MLWVTFRLPASLANNCNGPSLIIRFTIFGSLPSVMTRFLICLLILQLLAMLAWGLMQRARALQYPFLVAVGFAGYLLPQFIGLSQMSNLPNGSLNKALIMANV